MSRKFLVGVNLNSTIFDYIKTFGRYATTPLFQIGGNHVSVASVIFSLLIFYIALKLARFCEVAVRRFLKERQIDSGAQNAMSTITRYIITAIGLLISLDILGISLSSLAALGAVLMVGIGFGLQNIAQNFISGLIILLERPIKVGDIVEVHDISGRVVEIGARSTLIHTRDDVAIIVPNSQFISEQVINESFSGEKIRLQLKVGVAYGSDVDLVKKTLLEVAHSHVRVLKNEEHKVFFDDFSDSSLDFTLLVWVNDLWLRREILSDLRFLVDQKFKEKGITIPFPQRDIHLYNKS